MGIELIKDGVKYNGKELTVKSNKAGDRFVFNVDGKRIRLNSDRFVLMYTFFSMLYNKSCEDVKCVPKDM